MYTFRSGHTTSPDTEMDRPTMPGSNAGAEQQIPDRHRNLSRGPFPSADCVEIADRRGDASAKSRNRPGAQPISRRSPRYLRVSNKMDIHDKSPRARSALPPFEIKGGAAGHGTNAASRELPPFKKVGWGDFGTTHHRPRARFPPLKKGGWGDFRSRTLPCKGISLEALRGAHPYPR